MSTTNLARGTWRSAESDQVAEVVAKKKLTLRQDKRALLRAISNRAVDVADDRGGDFHFVLLLDVLLDGGPANASTIASICDAFLVKARLNVWHQRKKDTARTRMMSAKGGCDAALPAVALDLVALGLGLEVVDFLDLVCTADMLRCEVMCC
jgi:hypothetical protein